MGGVAQVNTQRAVRHAVAERVAVTVVINKVDRLITELKLPPADAYHKLRHTLEEVNALLRTYGTADDNPELDPVAGNVVFAAADAGWSFTLQVSNRGLAARLRCGCYYLDKKRPLLTSSSIGEGSQLELWSTLLGRCIFRDYEGASCSCSRLRRSTRSCTAWPWTRAHLPASCGGMSTTTPTRAVSPAPSHSREIWDRWCKPAQQDLFGCLKALASLHIQCCAPLLLLSFGEIP